MVSSRDGRAANSSPSSVQPSHRRVVRSMRVRSPQAVQCPARPPWCRCWTRCAPGRTKPYVTIGEDVVTPGPAVDVESEEIVTTLHVWSEHAGLSEAKVIMGQIKDALHNRPLTVAGFRPVRLLFLHSRAFTQPDGMIRHGVIQFQARIERL
ncbi:DUF3168 domain-containing protein [Azospirillum sp. HJ39]|uniref:DUF3168 domain-containing protein n=1 Tax=Azospirillum sp. HJ39 TaxID=3159496 RepID=UPI0035580550